MREWIALLVVAAQLEQILCWYNESNVEEFGVKCPPEAEFYSGGRMFRDLHVIGDEDKFTRAKREPRLFTFTTNKRDVDVSFSLLRQRSCFHLLLHSLIISVPYSQ